MEIDITRQPNLGTWNKLPTEQVERKPRIQFEVNIPVEVEFLDNEPKEFQGETGAYYVFAVKHDVGGLSEEKVIMTSAWSLLRSLKILTPLKNKKVTIVKRMIKGKQQFEVK